MAMDCDVLYRIGVTAAGVTAILVLVALVLSVLARRSSKIPHSYSTGHRRSACMGESCNRQGAKCANCLEGA